MPLDVGIKELPNNEICGICMESQAKSFIQTPHMTLKDNWANNAYCQLGKAWGSSLKYLNF
jgi:hypothetical protein